MWRYQNVSESDRSWVSILTSYLWILILTLLSYKLLPMLRDRQPNLTWHYNATFCWYIYLYLYTLITFIYTHIILICTNIILIYTHSLNLCFILQHNTHDKWNCKYAINNSLAISVTYIFNFKSVTKTHEPRFCNPIHFNLT